LELLQLARRGRLDIIAITDHDITDGYKEASAAAQGPPLVIPGIELSAEDDGHDVHMLGYYVRTDDPDFQARLEAFRQDRLNRGRRIVERLAELGKPVSWARVLEIADGGSVGRPHIARAMVEAGYVESINGAFALYLHTGGPAYVSRERLSPEAAIQLIHRAGGAAVMAHPGLVPDYLAMVHRLVPAGLDGVEIMHPKNSADVRANLRALARQYHLIVTGGSDFHRPATDQIGTENPPAECVGELRRRAERYR
jgi:predicted metal-dependent phosphoesterase TrpH